MSIPADFILASASPRRAELLQQIGARFRVAAASVDEAVFLEEPPEKYVCRMAELKARTGWEASDKNLPVMGADTAVVCGDTIFGKPVDKEDALAMLASLSAKTHRVISAVSLCADERIETRLCETLVTFRNLTIDELENYWQTGEPVDKARAYGIQGFAAVFVVRIEGSYSSVVGLPLAETCELLKSFKIAWWQTE